jgi:hypothetical protein
LPDRQSGIFFAKGLDGVWDDLPVGQSNSPSSTQIASTLNDLGIIYEQNFPESAVLTQASKIVEMSLTYISD